MSARPSRPVLIWIAVAILALPLAGFVGIKLGAKLIGYRAFDISSSSMAPSLVEGDRVMAAPYRGAATLERGDVVFVASRKFMGRFFVERVIGLPGDEIAIENGVVRLNGVLLKRSEQGRRAVSRGDVGACVPAPDGQDCLVGQYRELLPTKDGPSVAYSILEADENWFDTVPSRKVPSGQLFVLGDHRSSSLDSRMPEFGFVGVDNVRYRNGFIWYSDKDGVSRWLTSIAPNTSGAAE